MTVTELIDKLASMPANKEVYIQQGEEFDYTMIHNVKELEVVSWNEEDSVEAVVINFQ